MSIGNKMLPEGFDKDLEAKETGKKYNVEISPNEAFGKRNPQLIRMVPNKIFQEQKINPQRGMQLNLGGQLARVLSASGGRVLVDFNNPLAGKVVIYEYKILKKINSQDEKINALQDFLFKKQFQFSVSDGKEKTITFQLKKDEKQFEKFIELMSEQFKKILGMKIKVEITQKNKEEKQEKEEDKSKVFKEKETS
jgi:FKBP-type peptidyl-prolyl cis-trans isomerase 2